MTRNGRRSPPPPAIRASWRSARPASTTTASSLRSSLSSPTSVGTSCWPPRRANRRSFTAGRGRGSAKPGRAPRRASRVRRPGSDGRHPFLQRTGRLRGGPARARGHDQHFPGWRSARAKRRPPMSSGWLRLTVSLSRPTRRSSRRPAPARSQRPRVGAGDRDLGRRATGRGPRCRRRRPRRRVRPRVRGDPPCRQPAPGGA